MTDYVKSPKKVNFVKYDGTNAAAVAAAMFDVFQWKVFECSDTGEVAVMRKRAGTTPNVPNRVAAILEVGKWYGTNPDFDGDAAPLVVLELNDDSGEPSGYDPA